MANRPTIDILNYEEETEKSLHSILKDIADIDVLKDIYAFFKDYRSHFYQRKGWYDARLATLQGLTTFVLTSAAAFIGLLIQREIELDIANGIAASFFSAATVVLIVTMVMIVFDLRPRADYRELRELDLIDAGRVKYRANFYRKKIAILALQSSSNGLRIEERYRLLQWLFRLFILAFVPLLVSGAVLFGRSKDKDQTDYTQTPAKIQVVDARSVQQQIERMRLEIEALRARIPQGPGR
ncbi:MAG: hypothetical protein K1X75_15175 [Leptospirales bacterium]|nr:hypothetical protein [Leptospirales bacterium]